jgi:outer membrane protein assembly factor BamA
LIGDSTAAHTLMNNHLTRLYEKGYALAIWQLDSIANQNGFYHLMPGNIIYCDSIVGINEQIIRPSVFRAMLDWHEKKPFISRDFDKNISSLTNGGLIKISQHRVFFEENRAVLRISMDKINKNELSGLAGLQPSSDGKTTIIGECNAFWQNALRHGEKMKIQWQRQSKGTQRLRIDFNIPYCFKSPFGLELLIDLYRKNESFFQSQIDVSAQYLINPQQNAAIFTQLQRTSLINESENKSFTHRLVGISHTSRIQLNQSDIQWVIKIAQGQRESYSLLSASKKSLQKYATDIDYTLHLKNLFSTFSFHYKEISKSATDISEGIRLGGNQTIRGFQQESIYSKQSFILQTSMGWRSKDQSRFYLFSDIALIKTFENSFSQRYWSWGPGTSLYTPNGNILINYGWGKYPNQPILYKNGIFNLSYQVYF